MLNKLIFLTLICSSSIAFAQQQPKAAIQSSLAAKSMLFDVSSANDKFVIAVGERGHIVKSTDLNNWSQLASPVQSTLTGVTFVNDTYGWAVGHDSVILHTQDGGSSWQIQQYLPEQEKPLMDVAFRNEREGIAIGAYGLFYRTLDGGKTWQREFHTSLLLDEDKEYLEELRQEDEQAYLEERASILPHFNRVYLDGRTTYLAGELGLLAKSNDFGKTWQRYDEIYHGSFYDITRTQQGNLLAVGLRGHSFRSLKNGAPWNETDTGVTSLLNTIVTAADGKIYVLGNNGTLLISEDDGVSYQLKTEPDGKALIQGIVFKDNLVIASEVGIKVINIGS